MKKFIYTIVGLISFTSIISCSDDKETTEEGLTLKSEKVSEDRMKGDVPRDRIIYSAFGESANLSVDELIELYKEDISTANPDYVTNLKNMWLTVIKHRLMKEATEDQKLFYIKESLAIENNLAHFTGFYTMLATSTSIDRKEKDVMADEYYKKNYDVIQQLQWKSPEDKKKKEGELIYAKRNYTNIANFTK
ncbi:hypothetical protein [Flavobacterium sp. C4GT6]|uniref:hypothetical protein n=1 Tax=Flavobacterium sp. C4GT6 TaxID=3103818 RepID=UPI002ED365CD